MEKLSEELLDHIVCQVMNPLPSRNDTCYDDLLSLSMVSRKLCRITEPYIYRSLVIDGDNEAELLRTMNNRPALLRYPKAIYLMQYHDVPSEVLNFVLHLPNLQTLDLDITSCRLSDVIPILRLPSVTALTLSGVSLGRSDSQDKDDWNFVNENITYLEISFSDPEIAWEACDEIWSFAAVLRNLRCLHIHSDYEPPRPFPLNAPAFRCLVQAFQHAFQTTLRDFGFMYNDLTHGASYEGDVGISDQFDATCFCSSATISL